jgi:hypothetical protein
MLTVSQQGNGPDRRLGILAWVCIGAGVVIMLLVLFTGGKKNIRRTVGRKRYRNGAFRSKKKHLLDDKYYRNNRKY